MKRIGTVGLRSLGGGVLICAVIFGALCLWLYPNLQTLSGYRVNPSEIQVISGSMNKKIRRASVSELVVQLPKQDKIDYTFGRQYSHKLLKQPSKNDPTAVYIPNANQAISLYVNGAFEVESYKTFSNRLGLGGLELYSEVNSEKFHPGINRIEFLSSDSGPPHVFSELYVGNAQDLKIQHLIYSRHVSTLRNLTLFGILLGVIIAAMGLAMGGAHRIFIGMFVFSLLSGVQLIDMPQSFVSSWGWVIYLVSAISLGAIAFGVLKSDAKYSNIHLGAHLAAALGLVFSLATISSTFIHLLSFFNLIAIGLALPMLLLSWPNLLLFQVRTFRAALANAKQTSALKDQIISEKNRLLEKEYEKKILSEERQRFTRDIHDGIGGQLLSLLVRLRTGTIEMDGVQQEIKSGLNDLRLVVDSLDHVGDSLHAALATFHQRARAQCKAEQIDLNWTQNLGADGQADDMRQILHVYRILQECISNILRHAQASQIDIIISEQNSRMTLECRDNGIGMDLNTKSVGKGLSNIYERAKKLGGLAEISNRETGNGTRVHIDIPMIRTVT